MVRVEVTLSNLIISVKDRFTEVWKGAEGAEVRYYIEVTEVRK